MKLEGKYLGILGFGRTGRALKGLADRLGIKTFVSDLKEGTRGRIPTGSDRKSVV